MVREIKEGQRSLGYEKSQGADGDCAQNYCKPIHLGSPDLSAQCARHGKGFLNPLPGGYRPLLSHPPCLSNCPSSATGLLVYFFKAYHYTFSLSSCSKLSHLLPGAIRPKSPLVPKDGLLRSGLEQVGRGTREGGKFTDFLPLLRRENFTRQSRQPSTSPSAPANVRVTLVSTMYQNAPCSEEIGAQKTVTERMGSPEEGIKICLGSKLCRHKRLPRKTRALLSASTQAPRGLRMLGCELGTCRCCRPPIDPRGFALEACSAKLRPVCVCGEGSSYSGGLL